MHILIVRTVHAPLAVHFALDVQLHPLHLQQRVQLAPVLLLFHAIGTVLGRQSFLELVLLHIQAVLDIGSIQAREPEAWCRDPGQHSCTEGASQTVLVIQMDQELVIDLRIGELALVGDMGGDELGLTKESQSLVQEVGAKVIEDATALFHTACLSPAVLAKVAEAVEPGLEANDPAQGGLLRLDEFLDGQEIGVPAAVLEDGEDARVLLGEPGEEDALVKGDGEGLFDDDVLASLDGFAGQIKVEGVGGGDDDEIDGWVLQELCMGLVDGGGGVFGGEGEVGAGAVDKGGEVETLCGGDERCMED